MTGTKGKVYGRKGVAAAGGNKAKPTKPASKKPLPARKVAGARTPPKSKSNAKGAAAKGSGRAKAGAEPESDAEPAAADSDAEDGQSEEEEEEEAAGEEDLEGEEADNSADSDHKQEEDLDDDEEEDAPSASAQKPRARGSTASKSSASSSSTSKTPQRHNVDTPEGSAAYNAEQQTMLQGYATAKAGKSSKAPAKTAGKAASATVKRGAPPSFTADAEEPRVKKTRVSRKMREARAQAVAKAPTHRRVQLQNAITAFQATCRSQPSSSFYGEPGTVGAAATSQQRVQHLCVMAEAQASLALAQAQGMDELMEVCAQLTGSTEAAAGAYCMPFITSTMPAQLRAPEA